MKMRVFFVLTSKINELTVFNKIFVKAILVYHTKYGKTNLNTLE